MQKRTNNLQLEKATNLVSEHWFPFSQSVLESALDLLKGEDEDEESKEKCLSILKTDPSLYILCLKEIQRNFQRIRIRDSKYESSLIEVVSNSELRNALENAGKFKTHHSLSDSNKVQTKRLTEVLISATAVCELAKSYNVSKEFSFSSAVLRQLGYTLIAWNYPKIYKNITEVPKTKSQIDREVRRYLGFSPTMLALSIIKKFGLEHEYENLFFLNSPAYWHNQNKKQKFDVSVFSTVNKVCEIGEALARANCPEIYSSAREDFVFANTEIILSLGKKGVQNILSKVALISFDTRGIKGLSEAGEASEDLSRQIERSNYSRELRDQNSYLEVLPREVYEEVVSLYNKLEPDSVTKESIALFTKQVVPKTIFNSVTVYLIDSVENVLYPSLVLGEARIQKPVTIPIKTDLSKNFLYPALSLSTPIRETVEFEDRVVNMIAAAIGDPVVGIFVVEFTENKRATEIMPYFKAIKRSFCDCLKI